MRDLGIDEVGMAEIEVKSNCRQSDAPDGPRAGGPQGNRLERILGKRSGAARRVLSYPSKPACVATHSLRPNPCCFNERGKNWNPHACTRSTAGLDQAICRRRRRAK